jgi:hypothetical protein
MKAICLFFIVFLITSCNKSGDKSQSAKGADPSSGDFKPQYKLGVPTDETAKKMFDEIAYQRAVQVYLWGLPAVGMRQYRLADQAAMGGLLQPLPLLSE